jgi:iron complex transport system substrate-binding protein
LVSNIVQSLFRTEGRGFSLGQFTPPEPAEAKASALRAWGSALRTWASARTWMVVFACLITVSAHAETPARIVSTSPSITETLFALGLGDRVVGVSRFCRYPEAAIRLPKIGTFLKPDVELIAQLHPDLVIVHADSNSVQSQLDSLRIPFAVVRPGALTSVYDTIRIVGDAAGVPDRATALVANLQQRLGRLKSALAGRVPRKVLIIVGRRSGTLSDLVAVGRDSYLHEIVTAAGGTNVLGDPSLPRYPRISMETVIRLAPDVIIDDGEMGDTPEESRQKADAMVQLWRQSPVSAGREGRVYAVVSEAFTVPGPRVVEVAETVAMWLHGVSVK